MSQLNRIRDVFSSPSVIILGAGASYEFGAPLGESLWGQIINATASLQRTFEQYVERRNRFHTISQLLQDHRFEDPMAYAFFSEIVALYDEPTVLDDITGMKNASSQFSNNPHGVIARIAQRVKDANFHTSVDDFLRDNPSLLRPLRILIAAIIFQGLYERESDRQWTIKQLAYTARFNNPHDSKLMVDNWYQRFIGGCRPMLIDTTPITPVTVISFNYDRLMETILGEHWQKAERKFPAFTECFKFIYPYGCFAEFPKVVPEPGDWLRKQATGIGLADGTESSELESVRAAVMEAKQVFSIGFSYTETNMRLLGLAAEHGPKLFVQNFGNADTRLSRTLARFPGATTDAGSIAQLVRDGFFEQRSQEPPTPRLTVLPGR